MVHQVLSTKRRLIFLLNKCGIFISRNPIVTGEQFVTKLENEFIKKSRGILHIGAHLGQEGDRYFQYRTKVIWIEAIPSVYEELRENISGFQNQEALCALLGDENNVTIDFNLSSNSLASSSIFNFGNDFGFKNLQMQSKISLLMTRLDSIFSTETITDYEHWVIDVQGAELLVLKGAGSLLANCKSLLVEVSTRQVYNGGALWHELESFLVANGLNPLWQPEAESHENILFVRTPINFNRYPHSNSDKT